LEKYTINPPDSVKRNYDCRLANICQDLTKSGISVKDKKVEKVTWVKNALGVDRK
jgi:hypothetical protein